MGCTQLADLSALQPEKITETIDKYFAGMPIRKENISSNLIQIVKNKVLSKNQADPMEAVRELETELSNNEFVQESKKILDKARSVSRDQYGDSSLIYQSMFFLANSDVNTFTKAYKTANIATKTTSVVNQVSDIAGQIKSGDFFGGIMGGINAIKNTTNLTQQVITPNTIPKEDLQKFLGFHVNFISLLPVEFLKQKQGDNRIIQTVNYVLENAFGQQPQEKYVNDLFLNYQNQDKIDVDTFFNENYDKLKDDKTLRNGLVRNFIGGLTPMQLITTARRVIFGQNDGQSAQ